MTSTLRKTLVGALLLLALLYLVLSLLVMPRQALIVERLQLATNPTDVGLAFEDFSVSPADSDLQLAGWWMPSNAPKATLVFIHGGNSSRHSEYFESLRFYRAMVDAGINVAAIDLRNHGESGSHPAGMQFGRTEHADALAAVDWARKRTPDLPLVAMGISMGGATVIQAAHAGANIDGMILLDPLLDSRDVFARGAWVATGLPTALMQPAAWAATAFYGLPSGAEQALDRAFELTLPILLLQDPDDPVTRLPFAEALAGRNPAVEFWVAPPIPADHPDLVWKGRWGSHVSAFAFFPTEVTEQINGFLARLP